MAKVRLDEKGRQVKKKPEIFPRKSKARALGSGLLQNTAKAIRKRRKKQSKAGGY